MINPSFFLAQTTLEHSGAEATVGSTVPDAPVKEPETEPVPETSPPPARQPEPSPFDPDWPDARPEPQPKA